MKIGLFSFKQGVGCSSMAIHMANFLASDDNNKGKVALREKNKEDKFRTAKADFAEDGTFVINDVRYYSSVLKIEPTEDFIVDDIGKIGILHRFDADYAKIYLCTDGSDEDLEAYLSYKSDNPSFTPDVVLFGASKECIHKWSDEGLRTILIGKVREKRLPQNFAMAFSTFLRLSGIVAPIYKHDYIFAPVIFGDKIMIDDVPEEKPEENKGALPEMKMFVTVPEPTNEPPKSTTHVDVSGSIQETVVSKEEPVKKKGFSLPSIDLSAVKGIASSLLSRKTKPEETEVEEVYDSSMLDETPMLGNDFSFDSMIECKDMSAYALFSNKRYMCFGLKDHIRNKHHYDNSDETLLHLKKINKDVVQFMTSDLLSGDYVLNRFNSEEIWALRAYFDFMCRVFKREISKTVTLREYVEFKQYYNKLCETKLMLDEEERARRKHVHDLYVKYSDYAELYNVDIREESGLINEDVDSFLSDISFIMENHVGDPDVKDILKALFDDIKGLKPEPKPEVKPEPIIEPVEPEVEVTTNEDFPALNNDYKLTVMCYNDDGDIEDRASYAVGNIDRAVSTYLQKEAFLKKLCIKDKTDHLTTLLSCKGNGAIMPAVGEFNEDVSAIKDRALLLMSEYAN